MGAEEGVGKAGTGAHRHSGLEQNLPVVSATGFIFVKNNNTSCVYVILDIFLLIFFSIIGSISRSR